MALTIGTARANWEYERVLAWSRYSHLVWPLLGASYLAWVKAGRKWVPMLMCVVAALAFPGNTGIGLGTGYLCREQYKLIEADLRADLPAEVIVRERFPKTPHEGQEKAGVRGIRLLRAAGVFPGKVDAHP
ncbi:MAG TPA: hypothetical protein VLM40_14125, partial [Gemmata sp.]|nr:hypothetical protein [Gemmata sp.]